MSVIGSNILAGASGQGGGYQISRSVRLRSSATAYFSRTPATTTNRQTWTWSAWVKRGTLGTQQDIFDSSNGGGTVRCFLSFITSNALYFQFDAATASITTTSVYRDTSAWYHIILAVDSTQATASNRLKLYVNGSQITAGTFNYPSLNANSELNIGTQPFNIGRYSNAGEYVDGYLTEINFVDGQQLTPSSFGQTNSVTGVWQPIKYTGTYGTNGFYLNFSDNSNNTATTIGKDYSGNGNNWTPNNISVTAGVTYDSMLDVPTPYADGGNGRGNYAVLNPIGVVSGKTLVTTISNGNQQGAAASASDKFVGSTIQSPIAYYCEAVITAYTSGAVGFGVGKSYDTDNYYILTSGSVYKNGSLSTTVATSTTNDVIGIAADPVNSTVAFYKNNTLLTTLTGCNDVSMFWAYLANTSTFVVNFGQRPFSYTPPTGFVALNTQNLPTPTISNGANYMAATTYTGTGSSLTIANTVGSTSFQPDFVWVKGRSGATDHALYDSVRGTTKDLVSNSTAAETTQATGLTAFGSTGFTVGALAKMNTNTATYVGWQWKAGGTSSTNTSGSITSTVSAGATQGFSVVTYTGTGSAATVGHGLGVAPSMIIVKTRSGVNDWSVYHTSIGATKFLLLDTTAAAGTSSTVWNNTAPTSSVFSIATDFSVNQSTATYVAYCFSAVAGYSAFGSYTGNGSADGPFVYCGFRPRFIMVKRTDAAGYGWFMWDSSRNTYNAVDLYLQANASTAEQTFTSLDILSNGFKIRGAPADFNAASSTQIFVAFAENPFKNALAR